MDPEHRLARIERRLNLQAAALVVVFSVPAAWLSVQRFGGAPLVAAPAPARAPAGDYAGAWCTEFDAAEISIGGVFRVKPHAVGLSFSLWEHDGQLGGNGVVVDLLGDLQGMAMVEPVQRGTASGAVDAAVARLILDIPPFGAPPAPATLTATVTRVGDGLTGTCSINVAGSESAPAPCTFTSVADGDFMRCQDAADARKKGG